MDVMHAMISWGIEALSIGSEGIGEDTVETVSGLWVVAVAEETDWLTLTCITVIAGDAGGAAIGARNCTVGQTGLTDAIIKLVTSITAGAVAEGEMEGKTLVGYLQAKSIAEEVTKGTGSAPPSYPLQALRRVHGGWIC